MRLCSLSDFDTNKCELAEEQAVHTSLVKLQENCVCGCMCWCPGQKEEEYSHAVKN